MRALQTQKAWIEGARRKQGVDLAKPSNAQAALFGHNPLGRGHFRACLCRSLAMSQYRFALRGRCENVRRRTHV